MVLRELVLVVVVDLEVGRQFIVAVEVLGDAVRMIRLLVSRTLQHPTLVQMKRSLGSVSDPHIRTYANTLSPNVLVSRRETRLA